MGLYRYKAGKHFPADIIARLIVGATSGILIPEIHKVKPGKEKKLSFMPFFGNYNGLALRLGI